MVRGYVIQGGGSLAPDYYMLRLQREDLVRLLPTGTGVFFQPTAVHDYEKAGVFCAVGRGLVNDALL